MKFTQTINKPSLIKKILTTQFVLLLFINHAFADGPEGILEFFVIAGAISLIPTIIVISIIFSIRDKSKMLFFATVVWLLSIPLMKYYDFLPFEYSFLPVSFFELIAIIVFVLAKRKV